VQDASSYNGKSIPYLITLLTRRQLEILQEPAFINARHSLHARSNGRFRERFSTFVTGIGEDYQRQNQSQDDAFQQEVRELEGPPNPNVRNEWEDIYYRTREC
jgi:hypothetical protein